EVAGARAGSGTAVALDAPADVGHVAATFTHPLVALARPRGLQIGDDALDRPFGIDAIGAHEFIGPAHEQRVVEHQHLGDEDRGLCVAQRARQPFGDLLQVASRPVDRPPKALSLALDTARGESIPDLRGLAYDDDRAADGDTTRDAASLEPRHRA